MELCGGKRRVQCSNCYGVIDLEKEKFVLLGTYDHGKSIEEDVYHLECWRAYFKSCVANKVGELKRHAFASVGKVLKDIRGGDESGGQVKMPGM